MNARLKGMSLILALGLLTMGCSGTLRLGVASSPTPAADPGTNVEATVQAAVEATLAAAEAERAPGEPTYTEAQVWATAWAITEETIAAQTAMPDLLYSTYLGGDDFHDVHDIAVDTEGNAYVVGTTSAPDLPTTRGAYDRLRNGGTDVFVAKLSADGSRLLYSTYLGGSGEERGNGIAVDGLGEVYVTGSTSSTDFPVTPGAFNRALGGKQDAFVAKLSASGGELVYSTYLGGDDGDSGKCIAIDSAGGAYIGGDTHGGFPVTRGSAQTTFGGSVDGFVARLSPDGGTLVYGTYLGGSDRESIEGIAIDLSGYVYLATGTSSFDFPTTPGAYDRVCDNCATNRSTDAAAAELSQDGSEFVYSTLVGGTDPDCIESFYAVAVDSAGNAYLAGDSCSVDFPTTPGVIGQRFGGGLHDAVVIKLNAEGSGLMYSTFLGGAETDSARAIAVDAEGNATVAGWTDSVQGFTAGHALQSVAQGGRDAFVAELDLGTGEILYATYFGGSGHEFFEDTEFEIASDISIALDRAIHGVYLAGATSSSADLPTTPGAFDVTYPGGHSAGFVVLLSPATVREGISSLPADRKSPSKGPLRIGMVSDAAGMDDAGFNEGTWAGLQRAEDELGVQVRFLESQSEADYEKNIAELAEQEYDLIFTVGQAMSNATVKAASQRPWAKLVIVDDASLDTGAWNVGHITFNLDEVTFPAGYLAAGWAALKDAADPQIGYVGGQMSPLGDQYALAYCAGAGYYNEQKGTTVECKGRLVGNAESPEKGKVAGQSLIDEGVDVIFGLGGQIGHGGLTAAKEAGKWGIGSDTDQYYTLSDVKDILLTSCVKRADVAVYLAVQNLLDGYPPVGGEMMVSAGENGVGLAPYHDYESQIPADLKEEVAFIQRENYGLWSR